MPSHQKRKSTGTLEILMTGHGIGDTHRNYKEHSPVPGALCPPVLIYTPAATGVYTYRLNSSIYGRFTSPDSRPRGFSMMHTSIPVAISQDAIIIESRIEATANAYWGKTFRDANPDGQPKDTEYNFDQYHAHQYDSHNHLD